MQDDAQQYRYRVTTPFGVFQWIGTHVEFVVVYEQERAGRRVAFAAGWSSTPEDAERLAEGVRALGAVPVIVPVSVADRRAWRPRAPRRPEE